MYLKLKPNLVLSLKKFKKWERGSEREEETFKKWTWMGDGEGE
jgi:hypothetical protein